jgi:hypothetical protein
MTLWLMSFVARRDVDGIKEKNRSVDVGTKVGGLTIRIAHYPFG